MLWQLLKRLVIMLYDIIIIIIIILKHLFRAIHPG